MADHVALRDLRRADAVKVLRLMAAANSGVADQRDKGWPKMPAHLTPDPRKMAALLNEAAALIEELTAPTEPAADELAVVRELAAIPTSTETPGVALYPEMDALIERARLLLLRGASPRATAPAPTKEASDA